MSNSQSLSVIKLVVMDLWAKGIIMYSLEVQAKYIKPNTKVRKINGSKKYTLVDKITVYLSPDRKESQTFKGLFLIDPEGNNYINSIDPNKILCIDFKGIEDLFKYTYDLYEESESK